MREKLVYTFYSMTKKGGEIVNHGESSRLLYVWLWFQLDKKQADKVHYVVGSNGVKYFTCPFRFAVPRNINKLIADMQKELQNERKDV